MAYNTYDRPANAQNVLTVLLECFVSVIALPLHGRNTVRTFCVAGQLAVKVSKKVTSYKLSFSSIGVRGIKSHPQTDGRTDRRRDETHLSGGKKC